MAQESSDPQCNWADVCDAAANVSDVHAGMQCDEPGLYAQAAAGCQRSDSVSSTSTNGARRLLAYSDCMSDDDKEHIHPFNLLPDRPCSAHFMLPTKDVPSTDIFSDFKNCGIHLSGV